MFELILTDRGGQCGSCPHQQKIMEACNVLAGRYGAPVKTVRAYSAELRNELGLKGCGLLRMATDTADRELRVDFPEMCHAPQENANERLRSIFIGVAQQVAEQKNTGSTGGRRGKLFAAA